MESEKHIIPPRLKSRLAILGFYPEELLLIVPLALFGLLRALELGQKQMLIAAGILCVLWFRGFDNKNTLAYLKLLYKYYLKPQVYTLKECEMKIENQ